MSGESLRYAVVGPAAGTVILQLEGVLEGNWSDRLLESLAHHYIDDGVREIRLDLRSLRVVDDAGVETFRALLRRADERGKALTLEGAFGPVLSRLTETGVLPPGDAGRGATGVNSQAFAADPRVLHDVRSYVRELAASEGLNWNAAEELVLAVSEACANAILHSGSDRIVVQWGRTGDCVEVMVLDSGHFRDRLPDAGALGEAGRGTMLMMAMVDEVSIRGGTAGHPGTCVRLVKCPRS